MGNWKSGMDPVTLKKLDEKEAELEAKRRELDKREAELALAEKTRLYEQQVAEDQKGK